MTEAALASAPATRNRVNRPAEADAIVQVRRAAAGAMLAQHGEALDDMFGFVERAVCRRRPAPGLVTAA